MSQYADVTQRNTILLEEAVILSHTAHAGAQFILKIQTHDIAKKTQAGQFIHIQCGASFVLRRPISVMRANPQNGEMDLLYKVVGKGTQLLSQQKVGEKISILGPIGIPFTLDKTKPLLIGGGVGMPPMISLAEAFKQQKITPMVILGSEVPFPFQPSPSEMLISGMPEGVISTMPLMEDWDIPCRLTSLQDYAGCHQGYVTDLARLWLASLTPENRQEVTIYSCGPHPMLEAVHRLAVEFDLPCQVSLEEYMACGVGGCAGCVVEVKQQGQTEMKRVCVDGPVFNSQDVFGTASID